MVANLPSTLTKKRSPIRNASPPTTRIVPFQVLGYRQIFFPAIKDYASPSSSLYSLPHTRNPWPSPYTKLLSVECSQASLHTCGLQTGQSRSLIYSLQSCTSSSLLRASLSPTAALPDSDPTEGKPSSCSHPQEGHCLCPEGSNRGVSSGHEPAQSRSQLGAQMACEMSWHTLLGFLEHIGINHRYSYIVIEIDVDIDDIDIDEITVSFMMNISSEVPHTHSIGTVITFLTLMQVTILSHFCSQL